LDATYQAGAPTTAAASHKASNAWFKAFDLVYGGVAADCSIPTGKNRYHKFKDKIVELWTAMEQQAPDDHPLKERAVDQLIEYRKACEESAALVKKEGGAPTKPAKNQTPVLPLPKGATPAAGSAASKRSYLSTLPSASGIKWRNLNEQKALEALPTALQSLVHLRHTGAELKVESTTTKVEPAYQKALEEYLAEETEGKDAMFSKSLALVALYRQAQTAKESKEINQAYERTVSEYLLQLDPSTAEV
jgi:hypothetical protein